MTPLRRLAVVVLALAGALSWGPPSVLAICLRGGLCGTAPRAAETPPCCRKASGGAPSVDGSAATTCCGCCTKVHVGLGLDGAGPRPDVPVAPPAVDSAVNLPAAPALPGPRTDDGTAAPRPPPEKVLPLRI